MGNTQKSVVLIILASVFASGLAIAATADIDNVVAGRGWDMGACRIPAGRTSTIITTTMPVYFVDGEIINMPLHINNSKDFPDLIDIYIAGSPIFMERVKMGESRLTSGGTDKYADVIQCFSGGIDFDVQDSGINDEAAVQRTIDRYRDSTLESFRFTPPGRAVTGNVIYSDPCAAVQLQFYVDINGLGKVRIFPSCTVRHYRRSSSYSTLDYKTIPGSNSSFQKYDIYAYHYFDPNDGNNKTVDITDTYIDQYVGGQIYVNGNVIIGGDSNTSMPDPNQVVKGRITVIATGNIWIADSIRVYGTHDINGMPTADNPNVLGLIAKGVIKVVDPGMSSYGSASYSYPAAAPTNLAIGVNDSIYGASHKHFYQRIGMRKYASDANNVRCLPHNMVIEAAMTVGGGGFGAENVAVSSPSSNPNRKEYVSGTQDNLIVHGAIAEVVRGVIGMISSYADGFTKQYYYDRRLQPPAEPAGWTTLDMPGALNTSIYGIDGNKVVGVYDFGGYGSWYSFLYNGSTWTTIAKPGATQTQIYGIDGNNLVGAYNDDSNQTHGFLYNGSTWTTIDYPGDTIKTQVNRIDGNNLVGVYTDANDNIHGFLCDGITWTTLDMPGATSTYPCGISSSNIVGVYHDSVSGYDRGFLYNGITWTTPNFPEAIWTLIDSIDGNNMVGSYGDANYTRHGFFYNGTTWTTIYMPGADYTWIYDINGNNIVGSYMDFDADRSGDRGFIYTIPESAPVCSALIPGDLNGDCKVDFEDVVIMAGHWLENNLSGDEPPVCTSVIEGDLNNDCMVDFIDLAIEAAHWLESTLEPE